MVDVSFLSAFSAGFLLFFSPCVLPLVPSYLTYLSGLSLEGNRFHLFALPIWPALFFVFGFSTVFIFLGLGVSFAGGWFLANKEGLTQIGGIFIVLMGIHFLHIFRIPFLDTTLHFSKSHGSETAEDLKKSVWKYMGATYGVGAAFALSWTPCISPVLATILVRAGSSGMLSTGAALLATFALGLSIPFLLAASMLGPFIQWLSHSKLNLKRVEQIMGVLLILTGLWFLNGAGSIL
jgi:cytochrome c-type biogenesis protein